MSNSKGTLVSCLYHKINVLKSFIQETTVFIRIESRPIQNPHDIVRVSSITGINNNDVNNGAIESVNNLHYKCIIFLAAMKKSHLHFCDFHLEENSKVHSFTCRLYILCVRLQIKYE